MKKGNQRLRKQKFFFIPRIMFYGKNSPRVQTENSLLRTGSLLVNTPLKRSEMVMVTTGNMQGMVVKQYRSRIKM